MAKSVPKCSLRWTFLGFLLMRVFSILPPQRASGNVSLNQPVLTFASVTRSIRSGALHLTGRERVGDPHSLAAHPLCRSDTSVSRYGLHHSTHLHLPELRKVLTRNVKSLCPTSGPVTFSASLSPVPPPSCLPGDVGCCSLAVGTPDETTPPPAYDLMLTAGEKFTQKKIYTIRCCCHSSSEIFPLIYGSSC